MDKMANQIAAEIHALRQENAGLKAENERLRAELAAERADHEATIKSTDEYMREIAGHGY